MQAPATLHALPARPFAVVAPGKPEAPLRRPPAHWPQVLLALRHVRASYLLRFPQARRGWTLGHVQGLCTAVMAVPSYALAHPTRPVAREELQPVLATLFRMGDGVRTAVHQMLFSPAASHAWDFDAPVASDQFHAHQARDSAWAEFLSVLLDGHVPLGNDSLLLEPEVAAALHDLQAALDCALASQQAHAAVSSLWPFMARTSEQLLPQVQAWSEIGTPSVRALLRQLQGQVKAAQRAAWLSSERQAVDPEHVYAALYDRSGAALGSLLPPLGEQLQPLLAETAGHTQRQLAALLRRRLGRADGQDERELQAVAHRLAGCCLRVQTTLRVADEAQARVNRLLQRPSIPLRSADLQRFSPLHANGQDAMPDLLSELSRAVGEPIVVDARAIVIGTPFSEPSP